MWLHMSYQSLSTIHILFTGCGQHPGEDITLYCKTCGEGTCGSTCHTNLSLLFIFCSQVVGSIRERISPSTVRRVGRARVLHMSYQSLSTIHIVGQHPGEDITLYCKTCGEGACGSTCHTNLSLLFIFCSQVVGSIRERISLSTVRHVWCEGACEGAPHVIPISLYYSYLLFTGCGQHPGEDITLYCKTCGEGACDSTCHTNLSLLFIYCLQVVGSIRERISPSTVRRVGRARVTPHVIPRLFIYCSQVVGSIRERWGAACDSTFHTNLSLLFIYCLQVVGSIRERISLSTVRHVERARVTPHVIPISLYYSYFVHRLWAASGRGYHSLL